MSSTLAACRASGRKGACLGPNRQFKLVERAAARPYRYNPWDQGTRGGSLNKTKAGIDDAERLSQMLKVTNADGFFGDTISSSGLREFYDQGIKRGHPLAIQPEGGGTPAALNYSSVRVQIDHQPVAVHCFV